MSLSSILQNDNSMKTDLIALAPKLIILQYDYNEQIWATMKEVFLTLFTPEEEKQLLNDRWEDIMKEMMVYAKDKKEYRKWLQGALALSDYLVSKEWDQIKKYFEELFTLGFQLLEDSNEQVSKAGLNLLKSLKTITIWYSNLYFNSNWHLLNEILSIVFPLLLSKGVWSHIKQVSYFSILLIH